MDHHIWSRGGSILLLLIGLVTFPNHVARAVPHPDLQSQIDASTPLDYIVKLIFMHPSTGENWLRDDYGGLDLALNENNYFVSDTNYGWGPDTIGDRIDIPNWLEWFHSEKTDRWSCWNCCRRSWKEMDDEITIVHAFICQNMPLAVRS